MTRKLNLGSSKRMLMTVLATAFVAFLAAYQAPVASADVTQIVAQSGSFDSGQSVGIRVRAEDYDGTLVVNTSDGNLDVDSCTVEDDGGDCTAETSGSGSSSVTVDTDTADSNTTADGLRLRLTLSGVDCDDADENVTVTASQGGVDRDVDVTCEAPATEETGSLKIVLDTNPETSSVSFDFDSDFGDFDLTDDESTTFSDLTAGVYEVAENEASGWDLDEIDCNGDPVSISGNTAQIDLGEGEDVTCTFVNVEEEEDTGSITIVKDTNPETSSVSFDFDGDLGDFDLYDDDSITFTDLASGAYTVTETESSGWDLVDISCDSAAVSFSGHTVYIDLEEGGSVTCTFINEEEASTSTASLAISSGASTLTCGDSAYLTITALDADGSVVEDGTVVTLSTSLGSLASSSVQTSNGTATVLYYPPTGQTTNIATITAYTDGVYAYKSIAIYCDLTTVTAATATPAAATPVPVVQSAAIAPPSAGDAGLLDAEDGSSLPTWLIGAGTVLIAALLLGRIISLGRQRS